MWMGLSGMNKKLNIIKRTKQIRMKGKWQELMRLELNWIGTGKKWNGTVWKRKMLNRNKISLTVISKPSQFIVWYPSITTTAADYRCGIACRSSHHAYGLLLSASNVINIPTIAKIMGCWAYGNHTYRESGIIAISVRLF